jgi:hypothetical protein
MEQELRANNECSIKKRLQRLRAGAAVYVEVSRPSVVLILANSESANRTAHHASRG